MKVKVSQLIPGCILQADVTGRTGQTIVPKQTVLNDTHIKFLQKFLITNVHIYNNLADGTRFNLKASAVEQATISQEKQMFFTQYTEFVDTYKHQFNIWKAEQKVDVIALKETIMPIFNQLEHIELVYLVQQTELLREDIFYSRQVFSTLITFLLAKKLGFSKGELYQIGLASILSDSGFIKISDQDYDQAVTLFLGDNSKIIHHPVYSYRLIEKSLLLNKTSKLSILQHEECGDGTGYPLKLAGTAIHQNAKIIRMSDEFTKALYYFMQKNKPPLINAVKFIKNDKSTKLDSQIVDIFISQLTK